MDAGRGTSEERGAVEGFVRAHGIHGMSGFVQRTEQGGSQVIGVHTRGDTNISPSEAGGEGMQGLILAATLPFKAHLGDGFHAKLPLRCPRHSEGS